MIMSGLCLGSLTDRIKRLSRKELDHHARYDLAVGILNHILAAKSQSAQGTVSSDGAQAVDGSLSDYLAKAHLRQLAETLQHILLLDSESEGRKDSRFWEVILCAISQESMDVGVVNKKLTLAAMQGLQGCGDCDDLQSVDKLANVLFQIFQTIQTRFTLAWLDSIPKWVSLLEVCFALEMKAVESGSEDLVKNLSRLLRFLLEELLVFRSQEGVWPSLVPSKLLFPALARLRFELDGKCHGSATRVFLSEVLFARWYADSFARYLRSRGSPGRGPVKKRSASRKKSEKLHIEWLFGELRNGIIVGALPHAVSASVAVRLSIVSALPWMLSSCSELLDAAQEQFEREDEPTLKFAAFVTFLDLLLPGIASDDDNILSKYLEGVSYNGSWSLLLEPVGNLLTECMKIGAIDPTHNSYIYQLSIVKKIVNSIVMGAEQSRTYKVQKCSNSLDIQHRNLCIDSAFRYAMKPLLQLNAGLMFPHIELMLDVGISEKCPKQTGKSADPNSSESMLELMISSYASARMVDVFLDALLERLSSRDSVACQSVFYEPFLDMLQTSVREVPIMQHTDIVSLMLRYMANCPESMAPIAIMQIAEIVLCVLQATAVTVENSDLVASSCAEYLERIEDLRVSWDSDSYVLTRSSSVLLLASLKIRNSTWVIHERCVQINPSLLQAQHVHEKMMTMPSFSQVLMEKFDFSQLHWALSETSNQHPQLCDIVFDLEGLWKSVCVEDHMLQIKSSSHRLYKYTGMLKSYRSYSLHSDNSSGSGIACQIGQPGPVSDVTTGLETTEMEEELASLVASMYSCMPERLFQRMEKSEMVSGSFFSQRRSSICTACWAMLCRTYHLWAPNAAVGILNEFMMCLLRYLADSIADGDETDHLIYLVSWEVLSHAETFLIDRGMSSLVACLGDLILEMLDNYCLENGFDVVRSSWRDLFQEQSNSSLDYVEAILREAIEQEDTDPCWQNVAQKTSTDLVIQKLVAYTDLASRLPWESMNVQYDRALSLALGICVGLTSLGKGILGGFGARLTGWIARLCMGRGLSTLWMKFMLILSSKSLEASQGIKFLGDLDAMSIVENMATISMNSLGPLSGVESIHESGFVEFLKALASRSCEGRAIAMSSCHGYFRALNQHKSKATHQDADLLVAQLEEPCVRLVLDFISNFNAGSTSSHKMAEYCSFGSACHAVSSCIDWHARHQAVNNQFLSAISCVPRLMEFALVLHSKKLLQLLPEFCLLGIMDLASRMSLVLSSFTMEYDAQLWTSALMLHVIMLPPLPHSDGVPFFAKSILSAKDPLIVSRADSKLGARLRKAVTMSGATLCSSYHRINPEGFGNWMTALSGMAIESEVGDTMYSALQVLTAGMSSCQTSKADQKLLFDRLITTIIRLLSSSRIDRLPCHTTACLILSLRGLAFLFRNASHSTAKCSAIECARLGAQIFGRQDKPLAVQYWIGPFVECCSMYSMIAARQGSDVVETASVWILISVRALLATIAQWLKDGWERDILKCVVAFVTATGKIAMMRAGGQKLIQELAVEYCKAIATMRKGEEFCQGSKVVAALFSGALEVYAALGSKQRIALNSSELQGASRLVLDEVAHETSKMSRFKRKL